jgi:hypothetical protein
LKQIFYEQIRHKLSFIYKKPHWAGFFPTLHLGPGQSQQADRQFGLVPPSSSILVVVYKIFVDAVEDSRGKRNLFFPVRLKAVGVAE